jgi:hypothetical protein
MPAHLQGEEEPCSDAHLRLGTELPLELLDDPSNNRQPQTQPCRRCLLHHLIGAFQRNEHRLELFVCYAHPTVGNDKFQHDGTSWHHLAVVLPVLETAVHLDKPRWGKLDRIGDQVGDDGFDLSRIANDLGGDVWGDVDAELETPTGRLRLI